MYKDYIAYISSLFIFGMNGIIASFIDLTSYEIVLFRTMIGSVTMLIIFLLTGHHFTFGKRKRDMGYQILSGMFNAGTWIFLYEGYQQIGVGITTLLSYCGPVIVILLSPVLFKEKLTFSKIMGAIIVAAGFFLLNGQMEGNTSNFYGVFCGIMAAVLFAIFVILNKKAETITGLEKSVIQIISCFLTVAVYVWMKQGISIQVAAEDWLPILILGIVNTGFGAAIYYASMGKLSTQTVSVCGYIEPLSAVVFSYLILKERMTMLQIAGGILILGGALFAEWSSLKTEKSNK